MSPAKSPGSSRRKGKAVAFDPPVVSEEVDRSDSDRFVEEEAERDPNGECAPLIDPWYETSPYFPKAPGEYVPPPPGRVLITLSTLNLGPARPWVGRRDRKSVV